MNILCCCLSMAPNTKVTRKWEVFAGRNKFYCDGYCMTAPNSGVFYLTVILITVTSGLFFAFDCPFLADRISPVIPVIGGFLFIFTMSSLLRTSFSDPGIIPRASSDEAAYIEKQIEVPNSLNSPTYRPPPRTKEVFVKGQTVKLKYCFTCKIFRPPRASHCSLCDNCVDRFDHHCPWVGNCVGKRNYRFFYMFIVSLAFLAVFIFACSTTHLVMSTKEKMEFIDVVKQSPTSVIVAVICFFSVWSVIGLAGFHTYLTTSDQTTNEDIKGSFTSKGGQQNANPYSQGNICLNCFHILCGPIAPSLIDRRGLVNDEFRLQMQQQYQAKPTLVVQPMRNIDSSIKQLNVDLESGSSGAQFPAGGGVYRQRSYDNLQNGKSRNYPINLQQSASYQNISNNYNSNNNLNNNNSNVYRNNYVYSSNKPNSNSCNQNFSHKSSRSYQMIPTNFQYFSPQTKYTQGRCEQHDLVMGSRQQQQLQFEEVDSNSLPRYPYHKNRAISVALPSPSTTLTRISQASSLRSSSTQSFTNNFQSLSRRTTYDSISDTDGGNTDYYDVKEVPSPPSPPSPSMAAGPTTSVLINSGHCMLRKTHSNELDQIRRSSPVEYEPMLVQAPRRSSVGTSPIFQHGYIKPCKKTTHVPVTSHQHYRNSPYVNRKNKHRHSNIYEYHFNNYDLNSIHEDSSNES